LAELNIKLAAYYVRHCLDHVSRDCDATSITLAAVQAVRELKEYKENYKAPDKKPKIDDIAIQQSLARPSNKEAEDR
jgi:hypothetical protein